MIKLGVTGGIGSGKSTVCEIFRLLGVPIYEADAEARILQNSHPQIVSELKQVFGDDIYDDTNQLKRKKLASLVFGNPELLAKLNQIVHPKVRKHFLDWLESHKTSPYIVYEAAILFESGFYRNMDKILLVTAPEALRISRVIARDTVTEAEVRRRIGNQLPEDEKRRLADAILDNNNQQLLIPKIVELDRNLKQHGNIC